MINRPRSPRRQSLTLYKSKDDLKRAIVLTLDILIGKDTEVEADENGYYLIDDICNRLKATCPDL